MSQAARLVTTDGDEQQPPEHGSDPKIPVGVFILIFLGQPILISMTLIAALAHQEVLSIPLAIGLLVGHVVSIAALIGFYFFVYKQRDT